VTGHPRLVLAAAASHAGKTTVAAALACALAGRGVACFKVGPDYVDPGHLAWASGRPARNLDTWLLEPATVLELFRRSARGLALIEGAMGLYDGRGATPGGPGSTLEVARLLRAPVVLLLDASGLGPTVSALVRGFRDDVAGVILNRVGSEAHGDLLREALRDVPVYGALPRDPSVALPEGPLGLLTAPEMGPADQRRRRLAAWARRGLDLDGLLRLAASAPPLPDVRPRLFAGEPSPVRRRIALAADAAFQFYYPDALDLLAWRGVEWVPFSPLRDTALPPAVDAVYLGGGFPERHLEALSENRPLWRDLRGRETYAECGGLMALCEEIVDPGGRPWPMAGLIPGRVRVQERLAAVGYREAEAVAGALFLRAGDRLRGHEFRYSRAELPAAAAAYRLRDARGRETLDGHRAPALLAGYLHVHFAAHPEIAARWAKGGSSP
jgi:cobyrinic acid a,c-diamide synthase